MRTRLAIILVVLGIPTAFAAAQSTPNTTPVSPQTVFSKPLLADVKVTKQIKTLLTSKAGFIDPAPVFADLTGDGKSDSVVSIDGGGAAGTIAVYVLSTDGSKNGALKVVYRNQELYRATTAVSDGVLTIANPKWSAGDDLWAPKKIVQRTYAWKASKKTLLRTGTTTIDGPKTVTTVVPPGTATTPAAPTG